MLSSVLGCENIGIYGEDVSFLHDCIHREAWPYVTLCFWDGGSLGQIDIEQQSRVWPERNPTGSFLSRLRGELGRTLSHQKGPHVLHDLYSPLGVRIFQTAAECHDILRDIPIGVRSSKIYLYSSLLDGRVYTVDCDKNCRDILRAVRQISTRVSGQSNYGE